MKKLFIGLGVIALIGGGIYAYQRYSNYQEEQAAWNNFHDAVNKAQTAENSVQQVVKQANSSENTIQSAPLSTQMKVVSDSAHSFEVSIPASWEAGVNIQSTDITEIHYHQNTASQTPGISIVINNLFPTLTSFEDNVKKTEAYDMRAINYKVTSTNVPGATEAIMESGAWASNNFVDIYAWANGKSYLISVGGFKSSDAALASSILQSFKIVQ